MAETHELPTRLDRAKKMISNYPGYELYLAVYGRELATYSNELRKEIPGEGERQRQITRERLRVAVALKDVRNQLKTS